MEQGFSSTSNNLFTKLNFISIYLLKRALLDCLDLRVSFDPFTNIYHIVLFWKIHIMAEPVIRARLCERARLCVCVSTCTSMRNIFLLVTKGNKNVRRILFGTRNYRCSPSSMLDIFTDLADIHCPNITVPSFLVLLSIWDSYAFMNSSAPFDVLLLVFEPILQAPVCVISKQHFINQFWRKTDLLCIFSMVNILVCFCVVSNKSINVLPIPIIAIQRSICCPRLLSLQVTSSVSEHLL